MTNQITVDKLLEMRLSAMSDAFLIQLNDPQMQEVPFEDRFGMLVDAEYTNRRINSLKRLIQGAAFDQPEAHISAIDYTSGRKLNRTLIERLATCEYITEYRNIFITGAAGSGKTYLACAFGLAACMRYYKVRFIRLPDMLMELIPLVGTDAFAKAIKKYTNPTLLIIDEWLLTALSDEEAKVVFEVIHKRRKKSSTIFCSQFLDDGWYERIGSSDDPLADSIMDRIKYDAYKIKIQAIDAEHDKSMREVYGLNPDEAE